MWGFGEDRSRGCTSATTPAAPRATARSTTSTRTSRCKSTARSDSPKVRPPFPSLEGEVETSRGDAEFKEIRKEWRARKKAESEARTALAKHGPASSSSLSVGLDMRPATATILPPSLPSSRPVTSHLSSSSPAYAMATVGGGMPLGGVASYYAPRPVTGGGGQLAVPPASAGAGQAGGYADAGAGTAYAGDFSYHRPASSAGLGGTPWSQGASSPRLPSQRLIRDPGGAAVDA